MRYKATCRIYETSQGHPTIYRGDGIYLDVGTCNFYINDAENLQQAREKTRKLKRDMVDDFTKVTIEKIVQVD